MNQNLNHEERELVRLSNYFGKVAKKLIEEDGLSDQHNDLVASCNKIVEAVTQHADYRAAINLQREQLKNVVKDNAVCPKCNQTSYLKLIGVDTEEDWKCNKYKCRKCNITFVWNRPNNLWDMLKFFRKLREQLLMQIAIVKNAGAESEISDAPIQELDKQIESLESTLNESDRVYNEMLRKDEEMATIVKDFKRYLMIEKVKIEA